VPLIDAELAIVATESGAAVLGAKYGTSLIRHDKSSIDFATDADLEAEQAIMGILRAARPDDAYVGEESGAAGIASASRTWLVDPLCGTLNFAAQTPLAAVNVALRSGNSIVAAASADPFTAEVFWTDGQRAYVRRADGDEVLMPSPHSRLVDVNLDAPYPNAARFMAARLLASPDFTDTFRPRVMSTTLALAWVAAGRRAAYVTDGHLEGSVHFASGIALCQAAGCVVTDLRGQPLHSGVGGLIAAADEASHAALVAIIDRQFKDAS
jgi:myo-inositol-1(or 4)-monophosphatase